MSPDIKVKVSILRVFLAGDPENTLAYILAPFEHSAEVNRLTLVTHIRSLMGIPAEKALVIPGGTWRRTRIHLYQPGEVLSTWTVEVMRWSDLPHLPDFVLEHRARINTSDTWELIKVSQ